MSSANAEKISLTLKGLVPFVLGMLANKGLDIPEGSIYMLIDQAMVIGGAFFALLGAARKFYHLLTRLIDSQKGK